MIRNVLDDGRECLDERADTPAGVLLRIIDAVLDVLEELVYPDEGVEDDISRRCRGISAVEVLSALDRHCLVSASVLRFLEALWELQTFAIRVAKCLAFDRPSMEVVAHEVRERSLRVFWYTVPRLDHAVPTSSSTRVVPLLRRIEVEIMQRTFVAANLCPSSIVRDARGRLRDICCHCAGRGRPAGFAYGCTVASGRAVITNGALKVISELSSVRPERTSLVRICQQSRRCRSCLKVTEFERQKVLVMRGAEA